MCSAQADVRYVPKADISLRRLECPLSANSGHRHSFDHFVSNLLDMDGHLKSERFGSLEINQ